MKNRALGSYVVQRVKDLVLLLQWLGLLRVCNFELRLGGKKKKKKKSAGSGVGAGKQGEAAVRVQARVEGGRTRMWAVEERWAGSAYILKFRADKF